MEGMVGEVGKEALLRNYGEHTATAYYPARHSSDHRSNNKLNDAVFLTHFGARLARLVLGGPAKVRKEGSKEQQMASEGMLRLFVSRSRHVP